MTVCNRCGKENQDHYKFCLGCGAELTAAKPAGGDMAMMKTMMQDPNAHPPVSGGRASPVPQQPASRPSSLAPMRDESPRVKPTSAR